MQPADVEVAGEHVRVRSASAVSLVPSEYSAFADVSLALSHGRSSVSSFSSLPDQQYSSLCESLHSQNLQAAEKPLQVTSILAAESDSLLDTHRRRFQPQLPNQHESRYHPLAGALLGADLCPTSSPFKPVTIKMVSSEQAVSGSREPLSLLVSGDRSLSVTGNHTPVSFNPGFKSPGQASQSSTLSFGLNSCSRVNTPTPLVDDAAICPVSPSVFDIFTMLIRAAHFLSSVQNSVAPQSPLASCANPRNGEL